MNPPRVLLANHDRLFLDSLCRTLQRSQDLPFDVSVAAKSSDGISEPVGTYDALVCSVDRSDELQTLKRLKAEHSDIPVVALVPTAEKSLADEARRAGADSVLLKGSTPEATAGLLRMALILVLNSKKSQMLVRETRQKSNELKGAIGEQRRILELSRSIAERPPVQQYPVLVVERDDDAAALLNQTLQTAGFVTRQLSNSCEDAVARLSGEGAYQDREKCPPPFLVFLNLNPAEKSGFELLQWLRSRPDLRNIVVIVLTASEDPDDIRRAYDLGANSVVTKPSTLEELQRLVNAVRQYWVRLNV
jgi:CheY-like chemotaxis protein